MSKMNSRSIKHLLDSVKSNTSMIDFSKENYCTSGPCENKMQVLKDGIENLCKHEEPSHLVS